MALEQTLGPGDGGDDGGVAGPRQLRCHHLDRPRHGVQAHRARGGAWRRFYTILCLRTTLVLVKSQEIKHYLFLIENKIVPTDRKTFMVLVLTQIRVIFRNYIAGNVRIVRLSDCTRW